MRDERFLRVVMALASVSGCAADPGPPPVAPEPAKKVATPSETSEEKPSIVQGDPTEGYGKCRCSWDTNANAAPRVCKKGEVSYNGGACVRGARPKYPIAIGPLPPPDLLT